MITRFHEHLFVSNIVTEANFSPRQFEVVKLAILVAELTVRIRRNEEPIYRAPIDRGHSSLPKDLP